MGGHTLRRSQCQGTRPTEDAGGRKVPTSPGPHTRRSSTGTGSQRAACRPGPRRRNRLAPERRVSGCATASRPDRVLTGRPPASTLPPYGRVLLDILAGDSALSVSAEEAEQAWRIVEPVLEAWAENDVPLGNIRPGRQVRGERTWVDQTSTGAGSSPAVEDAPLTRGHRGQGGVRPGAGRVWRHGGVAPVRGGVPDVLDRWSWAA